MRIEAQTCSLVHIIIWWYVHTTILHSESACACPHSHSCRTVTRNAPPLPHALLQNPGPLSHACRCRAAPGNW